MTLYLKTDGEFRRTCILENKDSSAEISPSWNCKTVLMVGDRIDVLTTVKSLLQTCGYSVDTFSDPLMAAEHFSRRSHEYGVVISDMEMPSMSGFEFIKQVRVVNPEIVTFVITSADSVKEDNKDLLFESTIVELDGIIQEPFLKDDLCRIVGSGINRVV